MVIFIFLVSRMYRHYAKHIIHTHTYSQMKQLYEETVITILWFREAYAVCPRLPG